MSSVKALSGNYTLDPAHTRIGFVARHAMVTKVRGSFDDISGTANTGENLAGAKINVVIHAASIDTRNADRDNHLRSADFFNVEQYPTIKFVSTSVVAVGDDTLRVQGNLTIKDITGPVTIDFEYNGQAVDPFGNTRIGFEGSTQIVRSDFGLTWNAALEAGGVLVSDKITLEFEISAIKES